MINRLLARIEALVFSAGDGPLRYPPIFIIGPPRSGSTVLYQCLLQRYDLGYIANLHHRLYGAPALVEKLLRVTRWPRSSDYRSSYGNTTGWSGPSESWKYWYRFFPRHPQHVTLEEVDPQRLARLRHSMWAIGDTMKRPVLIKNLPCGLRLGPLHQALPEALYLVVQRAWLPMAQSILASRRQERGDYTQWWSVEPPNHEELLKRPVHEQVVEQIRRIYRTIDRDRPHLGEGRFLDIGYETFCKDVGGTLEAIEIFLGDHGVQLKPRGKVPDSFPLRSSSQIEPELRRQLEAYCKLAAEESYQSETDLS